MPLPMWLSQAARWCASARVLKAVPAPTALEYAPQQGVAAVTPAQHPELTRIQQLRDAGENSVADLLQSKFDHNQTLGDAQWELANMKASTPDLTHHDHPAFSDHYQQQRLAGRKPAEASAQAGMLSAVQQVAPELPDKAVKMLAEKAKDVSIDKFPGIAERFVKGLVERGVIQPFEGADRVAVVLENARDTAMHSALDSLYQAT